MLVRPRFDSSIRPVLHSLPPEIAHFLTLKGLRVGASCGIPCAYQEQRPSLRVNLCGKWLANPIGLAAGFDKTGEAIRPLERLGFGFLEIGGVLPLPQAGNSKPRVFRLSKSRAIINRMGFNSPGMEAVAKNISRAYKTDTKNVASKVPLAINIGKNFNSTNAIADYACVTHRLASFADFLVINISSPNTPGLRNLQTPEHISDILAAVKEARKNAYTENAYTENAYTGGTLPSILIKIAPDLEPKTAQELARSAIRAGAEGFIATNTTLSRPLTAERYSTEAGGLSGPPLRTQAELILAALWQEIRGEVPIIGVGGITNGEDLYRRICLGARAVQLYTALVWQGPALVKSLCDDLVLRLEANGFSCVEDAIGSAS